MELKVMLLGFMFILMENLIQCRIQLKDGPWNLSDLEHVKVGPNDHDQTLVVLVFDLYFWNLVWWCF